MAAPSSLLLYKRIKWGQRRILHAIANNSEWFIGEALGIFRAYTTLELRANMLYERSAIAQMKKIRRELDGGK
jgi:hypothetical protein